MTELLEDASGSIVLIRRDVLLTIQSKAPLAVKHSFNPAAIGIGLTSFMPVEKPPPPLLPRPVVVHQPQLRNGESSKHLQYPLSKRPKSADEIFYAHFVPMWCCACALVVIGLFFCPILALIGCVFAFVAKSTGMSHEKTGLRLKRAEDCNRIACHLGVSAIITGFIILATITAVLLFLFLSNAKVLLTGSI